MSVEAVEGNATEAGTADEQSDTDKVEVQRQFGPSLRIDIAVALHFRLTGGVVATPHDAHSNDRVPERSRRVNVKVEAV